MWPNHKEFATGKPCDSHKGCASPTEGYIEAKTPCGHEVPALFEDLRTRDVMAAKALIFTCLTGSRTGEVLGMRRAENDFDNRLWICPAERTKTREAHRVPLTDEMLEIIEPLKAFGSEYVFEDQKRHKPLSNIAMLMLLRRMKIENVTRTRL